MFGCLGGRPIPTIWQVSGGGPPPYFNNVRDNVDMRPEIAYARVQRIWSASMGLTSTYVDLRMQLSYAAYAEVDHFARIG